jgi:hypothetical protein
MAGEVVTLAEIAARIGCATGIGCPGPDIYCVGDLTPNRRLYPHLY